MKPLVGWVVVRDVRRVPELFDPGHEDLGSKFPHGPCLDDSGNKLVREELSEYPGVDSSPLAEIGEASRPHLLPGTATSYQRAEFGSPAYKRVRRDTTTSS